MEGRRPERAEFVRDLDRGLPRRARARRAVLRTVYARQIDSLHGLATHLDGHHPEYPAAKAARDSLAAVRVVLDLNAYVRTEQAIELNRLIRDEAWLRQVRRTARRVLRGGGDDGSAGVREPRRPSPDPGTLAAEVESPRDTPDER